MVNKIIAPIALAGFTVFYALKRLGSRATSRNRGSQPKKELLNGRTYNIIATKMLEIPDEFWHRHPKSQSDSNED